MTVWRFLRQLLLAAAMAGVLWVINTIWYKPFNINHFYDRLILEYALRDPETLTKLGLLDRYGIKFYNSELTLLNSEEEQTTAISKALEMLNSYKKSSQNASQRLSTAILSRYLEDQLLENSFANQHYLITPFEGIHLDFPEFMVKNHHVNTVRDAEDYLKRLGKFDQKMDKWIEVLQTKRTGGFLPPKYMLESVVLQIDTFLVTDTKTNLLYLDFVHKVDRLSVLSEPVKREMYFQANSLLKDVVYPSYEKLAHFLESSLDSVSSEAGLWRMENGEAYYIMLLRKYGSSDDMIGEELYQKALMEAEESKQQVQAELHTEGVGLESKDFWKKFLADSRYHFSNDSAGRAACLQMMDSLLRIIQPIMQQNIAVSAVPIPAFNVLTGFQETDGLLINYQPTSLNGLVSAQWLFNFGRMDRWHKALLPVGLLAETAEHYQKSIQLTQKQAPIFRKIIDFEAFREGWRAYALDWAMNTKMNTAEFRLAKLYWEYTKKMLLVLDVGIHVKHWTRQQAIDLLTEETAMPAEQAAAEVDRIVAYPAKAWAYYYGYQGFHKIRKKQEELLGKKFEMRTFHQSILQRGSMPLDILAKELEKEAGIK